MNAKFYYISACDFVQVTSLTDGKYSDCPHKTGYNQAGLTLDDCKNKMLSIPGANTINWKTGNCNVKTCDDVDDPMIKDGFSHATYVYTCSGEFNSQHTEIESDIKVYFVQLINNMKYLCYC